MNSVLTALLIPFLGTALGSAFVFFMKRDMPPMLQKILLGFASGVMVAASVWSLIIPAINMGDGASAVVAPTVGLLAGFAFLLLIDYITPHIHASGEAEGPSIRQFADDLLGFMDAHDIDKAHILGFSDGGNIAMIFAMKYPERVDKLILDGANLDAKGVKRSVQIPIEIGWRFAKCFAGKSDEARRNAEMLGLMVNDPNVRPEELSAIRAETLVIAGTKDMIKDEHTRLIARSIKDSRLVILKGNHFIANKCPDAFNRAVLDFLVTTKAL